MLNLMLSLELEKEPAMFHQNENIVPDQTIGIIPIDSIFTPIRTVKLDVENVRMSGIKTILKN